MSVPPGLSRVLQELTPLLPARLQKVSLSDDGRVVIDLFVGTKLSLLVDPRPPAPGLMLRPSAIPRGEKPPTEQAVLRKEIVPSRLVAVEVLEDQGALRLSFARPDEGARALVLELSASDARAVLVGAFESGERVLCVVGPARPSDGRDLRRGHPYEPPRAPGPLPLDGPLDAGEGAAERHAGALAVAADVKELRARVKAERRRLQRLESALSRDLAKHGDPESLARFGELLKGALSEVRRGEDHVVVSDWDGVEQRIPLEPSLSPQQNLERLFRRAKKAREGRARVQPRLEDARQQLAAIEGAREALLDAAPDDDVIERVRGLLGEERAAPSPRRRAALEGPRRPFRAFRASRDVVVRVGRSAKDNDELTFHVAKGNDLWLHARGVTGSHVVVPCDKSGELPPEVLLDAAHLAAWFSPARKSDRVDVQYTQRKHLRRPGKGAPAGLVLVPKERVLHLRVEKERLERLLANEIAPT